MTTDKKDPKQIHRRAVRREIVLPFVGGLILIVLLVVIAALEGQPQTSGISTTLLTVLLLCPTVICLVPIYLLLVLAVVGMNRANVGIAPPLRRLGNLSLDVRDRTYSLSDRVARTTINLSARLAPLDKLIFSFFDRPAQNEDDHE